MLPEMNRSSPIVPVCVGRNTNEIVQPMDRAVAHWN
jgi:hypothetical protein